MKSFFYNPERSEGTLLPKGFLRVPLVNPKNIGNNKPFFLKSQAQRGLCRTFFARRGGQRGNPIPVRDVEVLLYLKSRAQRGTPIAKRVLEVRL